MSSPRAIDTDLVRAYTARIATDYLLGYSLSPLLWRKLRGAKSAGRVQSVALRLVCDREAERDAHASITFYSITAFLDGQPQPGLVCSLTWGRSLTLFMNTEKPRQQRVVQRVPLACIGSRVTCTLVCNWAEFGAKALIHTATLSYFFYL